MSYTEELIATANAIATAGKGILAADESTGTIGKRFAPIAVENTEENRRYYREMIISPDGLEEYISGVIFYEEALYQKTKDGKQFVDLLKEKGIISGIKVDKGLTPLPKDGDCSKSTQGLDGLGARCAEYYKQGARFAKWRNVLQITNQGKDDPTPLAIKTVATELARYASICQENGLVPIVEPEILMDGDHTLEVSGAVTEKVLAEVYYQLKQHHVLLEGTLLKPNMCSPGAECKKEYTPQEIGSMTVRTLQRTMPSAVPGVTFLSGGQSEEQASVNLSAMNAIKTTKPWNLSFSYGRALQASCLKAWVGKGENRAAAQEALMIRAKANSEANLGTYKSTGEASESLFVANYSY